MPDPRSTVILGELLRRKSDRRSVLRRAAVLGVSAPLLSALTTRHVARAAAQEPATDLEGELTFWHGLTTEAQILNDTIVPAWESAYPNVTLDILQVPFDQLQNKYNTEASAGGGPDVLLGPSDWIGGYVEAEIIRPLDEMIDDELRASFLEPAIQGATFEDQLYLVPQRVETVALYYNKSMVQTPPANTDELLQMAGEMAGPDQYGFGLIANFYHNAGYLYGHGAQIFNEEGEIALNSPETAAFLAFLKTVQDSPGVFTQNDVGAVQSLFQEGKAAMLINGPWFLQAAEEAIGAENVGVAPLPLISGQEDARPQPFLGVTGFYINSNIADEQADLALTFARWMATEGTQPLVDEAGYLPASTAVQVPADDPIAQAFNEQLQSTVALPTDPRMGNVWDPAGNMVTQVLQDQATPEEAAEEAQQLIEEAG